MIYLFNSASRPEYKVNILNTLFLPHGCVNKYRYSDQHVDPEFSSKTKCLKRSKIRYGEEVAIIYIDRHALTGFVFHPIRNGVLEFCESTDNQMHINVKLLDYIYPSDIVGFQDIFKQTLGTKIPTIGNSHSENAKGFFALHSDNIFNKNIIKGNNAWQKAIENISETKEFNDPPKIIFSRTYLTQNGTNKNIMPSNKKDCNFVFKKNTEYKVNLRYRFPSQKLGSQITSKMEIIYGNDLLSVSQNNLEIACNADIKQFSFKTKKYPEDCAGVIYFKYPDSGSIGPTSEIKYKIKESCGTWINICILLILFSLASTVIGFDFSKSYQEIPQTGIILDANQTKNISDIFLSLGFFIKFGAAILQSIVIFFLLRVVGKKVF